MKENNLLITNERKKALRTNKEKPKTTKMNEWWGIDMTKCLVGNLGWLYVIIVKDWFTKDVIAWHTSVRPRTEEWLQALRMTVNSACPEGSRSYRINLMSDNGCPPTTRSFMKEFSELGINQAFTSYNNPKGNAAHLKWETTPTLRW